MNLRIPLAILAVALALTPLAAPLLAATHPLAALVIRDFFSRLCHQDPARSFVVDGSPVAVCVRCLGIYWGAAVGALLRLRRARPLLGIALVLNVVDVTTGALGWHGNMPLTRFFLGMLLGVGAGAVLFLPLGRLPGRLSPQEDASG